MTVLTPGLRCNQQCMYVYRLVPTVIGIPHAHSRITHLCSMHTAAQEPGTTCSRNYTWQYTTELVLGHCCTRLLAHKLGHSKLGSQENHLYNHQVATRSDPPYMMPAYVYAIWEFMQSADCAVFCGFSSIIWLL